VGAALVGFPSSAFSVTVLRGVQGRISFPSHGSCNFQELTETSWADCYAFKNRFDPATGQPILSNVDTLNALRGLAATAEISFAYSQHPEWICPKVIFQTNMDGTFTAPPPQSCGNIPPDLVSLRVQLIYNMKGVADEILGQIRGVWPKAQIIPIYQAKFGPTVYTYDQEYLYGTFNANIPFGLGQINSNVLKLGNITLPFAGAPNSSVSWLDYSLESWQDVVRLHERLRDTLVNAGMTDDYKKMFITKPATNCTQCYTIDFAASYGSYGKQGMMTLHNPEANLVWSHDGLVSPYGHEFGHSIHESLAPASFFGNNQFAGGNIDSQNQSTVYLHNNAQFEDMQEAFLEGIASALGQHLVDQSKGDWTNKLVNNYLPPYINDFNSWDIDSSCDLSAQCNYHRFRWHMTKRGITEGSSAWNARLNALKTFAAVPGTTNADFSTSNQEARFTLFARDLLASNADIGHNGGIRAGFGFIDDYLYTIGKILDGQSYTTTYQQYQQDVQPKNFQVSFVQLLKAMQNFCPNCGSLPPIGDFSYPYQNLSIHAQASPQSLGLYMVQQGWLTQDQLNNVLRANYMQEIN